MAQKILFSIFFLSALLFSQAVLAIGMITEPIVIFDVVKGQELEEPLQLINSENKAITYSLSADGDIKDWISFYNQADLTTPIDQIDLGPNVNLEIPAKIVIPLGTPNGKYQGQIIIMTLSGQDEETTNPSANVNLKVGRDVSITVTDKEIVKLESQIIPASYGVEKNKPLVIKMVYDNQGNISLKPNVSLKIIRAGVSVFEAIFPYTEAEPVKPRERKEVMIEWQSIGQEKGPYDVEIKVLLDDEVVSQDDFSFQLGVQKNYFLNMVAKIGGGNLTLAWLMIGGILLAFSFVLIMFRRIYLLKMT